MPVLCTQTLQWNTLPQCCVFNRCLKQVSDGNVVSSGSKLFHPREPAALKAWSPMVMQRVGGTSSADDDAVRSHRRKSVFTTECSSHARIPCSRSSMREGAYTKLGLQPCHCILAAGSRLQMIIQMYGSTKTGPHGLSTPSSLDWVGPNQSRN